MGETEKTKILNFLMGYETLEEFESWLYNSSDLEINLGADLYYDLLEINFKDKFAKDTLTIIINDYISQDDLESFKYYKHLENSGWYQNRSLKLNTSNFPNTPEYKNAIKIIDEFGGLKFISPEKIENWSLTLIEFLEEPGGIQNMSKYGLSKNLVCFGSAHNDHIDLFVDENNKIYKLDNVICEKLYEYKGPDFARMMRQLLQLEEEDNFEVVGSKNKNNSY